MGWKCPAVTRAHLLTGAELGGFVAASAAVAASVQSILPPAARVVVDANAILRSRTFAGISPMDVAKALMSQASKTKPTSIEIFFDSDDDAAYPPQRAAVHAQRYPSSGRSSDVTINNLARKFGAANINALASTPATYLPQRTNRAIDWMTCFNCPPLKAFLWRMLAEAVRHAAVERSATGTLGATSVYIYAADGVVTAVNGAADYVPLKRRYGEADLQTFAAGKAHAERNEPVILYSIDTDFLLMTMASVTFLPLAPFIVHLKCCVTDGQKLIAMTGGENVQARLNTALWYFGLGCDYADPLTRQGFYTKDIVHLGGTRVDGRPDAITVKANVVTLDVAAAESLLAIGTKRNIKRDVVPIAIALGDLLFCLRYYGFMFPADVAHPPQSVSYFDATKRSWKFSLV